MAGRSLCRWASKLKGARGGGGRRRKGWEEVYVCGRGEVESRREEGRGGGRGSSRQVEWKGEG